MNPHKDWPHAPVHRFESQGIYMVTGATMYKEHFFGAPKQLDSLENSLLTLAKRYQWQLEAWAVFSKTRRTGPEPSVFTRWRWREVFPALTGRKPSKI